MYTQFVINIDHPEFYYSLFYFLAMFTGFLLLLHEGHRRGYNTISWMLVIAAGFVFFIAGCRIINYSGLEWQRIRMFETIPYGTSRSVLGGIIFATAGIWIASKCLGFRHRTLDAFAFVLPVAIAIERFGCLLVGCCYGTPTRLPWGIQYGPRFHAFADQLKAGLLPEGSTLSLPVHPVQLYEVAGTVGIIFLLRKINKHIRAGGNLFLSSVCMYGMLRFVLDFIRAHELTAQPLWLGLSLLQIILVVVVPLLAAIIITREVWALPSDQPAITSTRASKMMFLVVIGLFTVLVTRWLDLLEITCLGIVWLPLLMILAGYLFTRATVPQFRLASIVLPLVSLVLMNQTIPERPKEGARVSYNTISVGGMTGSTNIKDSRTTTYTSGGCDGSPIYSYTNSTATTSDNQYHSAALAFYRTVQVSDKEYLSFGITGFSGSHHESFDQSFITTQSGQSNQHIVKDYQYTYSGLRPYLQLDHRTIGLGFGLMIGQMRRFQYQDSKGLWPESSATVKTEPVIPTFYLRIGERSKVFIDFGINSQSVPAYPVMSYQGALGIGIGKGVLRLGTGSYTNFFIAPIIPAGKYLVIEPFLGFGGSSKYSSGETTVGSINLHYKFGQKERGMK